MIPKVIHYCWFGRNPLPKSAQKCIASWRKFFPDYLIKEWNEDNFDVNSITYTREAYQEKKYAFVSDYARFWILYHYGGIYFDTDVEVVKTFDDVIENGAFMGIEVPTENGSCPQVAPGLGMGAMPGLDVFKTLLDRYVSINFRKDNGLLNQKTVVAYTTEVLSELGLKPISETQKVAGVWIYPVDFFNPFDSITGRLRITDNTHSIHWYMNSWGDKGKVYRYLSRIAHRLLGFRNRQEARR